MQTAPTLLAAAAALALAAACSPSSPPPARAAEPAPAAEFLLAAGDSTYWVTTAGGRTRVRGAPLTLARYGGRFYEVYVGDDDRSFYDAVFLGQHIFRRDLLSGDSAQVYADSTVAIAARRYAAAHPDEDPLGETEEGSENPRLALTAEVDLVASHGPFLTFDVRSAREIGGDVESSATRRRVVDLRTGRRVRLADLVGRQRAARVLAEGRRRFAATLDSVRAVRDERALRAQRALAQFVFDPSSFGLEDVERAPAVAFLSSGEGDDAGGYTLPLAPIVLDPPPAWWSELREVLPAAPAAATAADGARWARGRTEVEARYDSASAHYVLFLHGPRAGGQTGEWTLGRIQGPARQLYWLDAPPMDSAMRRALTRAFDESALYSDDARTVSWRGTPRPGTSRAPAVGCRVGRRSSCRPALARLVVRGTARRGTSHAQYPVRSAQ